MNYRQAEKYIYSLIDLERSRKIIPFDQKKFQRVRVLFDAIGNPDTSVRSIHIAGTKGKGSTSAILAHVLAACGYRVGIYTSPHLFTIRERISILTYTKGKIIEEMIPQNSFARLCGYLRSVQHDLCKKSLAMTFFELLTALAFLHFRRKQVDYAVIETGLGGRYDATNVIQPIVSVITRIDYDHMQYLGTTLSKIAAQKAGIIKRGVPVVCSAQPPAALAVIEREAKKMRTSLSCFGRDFSARLLKHGINDLIFTFSNQVWKSLRVRVPISGIYQVENAAIALQTACMVVPRSRLAVSRVRAALARVTLEARCQFARLEPPIIVDGAHNAISIEGISNTVRDLYPGRQAIVVFGASYDKDVGTMLRIIARRLNVKKFIFTRARIIRGMEPGRIKKIFGMDNCFVYDDSSAAIRQALSLSRTGDVVLICGSFYLAAEALDFLNTFSRIPRARPWMNGGAVRRPTRAYNRVPRVLPVGAPEKELR